MRIGVFGGTFDPIHNTHLSIAEAAMRQARLDKVLFVLSARPPHKSDDSLADAESRFAMVEAAVGPHPGFEASRIEIDRQGPSYMAETLATLKDRLQDADMYLIIGMDALNDLPNWRNPELIFDNAHILAAPRPGAQPPDALKHACTILDVPERGLSSTEIRQRIAKRKALDDLLPAAVQRMIDERGLYREAPAS